MGKCVISIKGVVLVDLLLLSFGVVLQSRLSVLAEANGFLGDVCADTTCTLVSPALLLRQEDCEVEVSLQGSTARFCLKRTFFFPFCHLEGDCFG